LIGVEITAAVVQLVELLNVLIRRSGVQSPHCGGPLVYSGRKRNATFCFIVTTGMVVKEEKIYNAIHPEIVVQLVDHSTPC
jgi:hypothetical protein